MRRGKQNKDGALYVHRKKNQKKPPTSARIVM